MPKVKKKQKDREKDKSREFVLILYPENEAHQLAYLALTNNRYASLGVLHNRDTYTETKVNDEIGEVIYNEGDFKKEHYHFYVSFSNPRYISGLAKELNIESHLIDFCNNGFKSYAEYMLHWGKHGGPGKYTYETDDFVGTLKGSAIQKLSNEPPDLRLHKIYCFIEKQYGYVDYTTVYKWAYSSGYGSMCTSRMNVVNQWLADHNKRYYETNHKI